jgi:hypothetical protein
MPTKAVVEGLVKEYANRGLPVRRVLQWAPLQPSSFYYKKTGGHKGKKPSIYSLNQQGKLSQKIRW